MRISFDLDDTLILSDKDSKNEPPLKYIRSLFYKEKLREGIVFLCRELNSMGYEICVYTTSERSVSYIKRLFKLYGIKLSVIVNHQVHQSIVQGTRNEIMPSKVPSRFGIDLHIDDDISVKQNGDQFGFRVLIIDKEDRDWCKKVLEEALRVKKLLESR